MAPYIKHTMHHACLAAIKRGADHACQLMVHDACPVTSCPATTR